ncbi:MAG: hemA [Burkholderiales bacterium]|jgi:glutamyl-tRNA reductase|nr:hemA [Burkholderiales bacterium]
MYQTFIFGLNYETADFEIREKLAFSRDEIPPALERLKSSGIIKEAFILSTCNRTEVYCTTQDINCVINLICDIQNVCPRTVRKHSYIHSDEECVNHLFRVASGLESMVLGETEIVAQTKDAVSLAKEHDCIGSTLMAIFQMAMEVEKDVRNVTEINNIAISIGSAACNLVAVNVEDIARQKILFIGAGNMMKQIAPYFANVRCDKKTIINRTPGHAQPIADKIGADVSNIRDLPNLVNEYSVIIASYNSDEILLNNDILQKSISEEKKLLIIDLSMPLVSDIGLRKNSSITMLTIDDIAKIVDVGVNKRKIAAAHAESIINAKLAHYRNWLNKKEVTPIIKALRDNGENIRQEVLAGAKRQLQNGEAVEDVLDSLSIKLTNKFLHAPTVNLCATNGKLQSDLSDLAKFLYDLEL